MRWRAGRGGCGWSLRRPRFRFGGFADVEDGEVVGFFFAKFGEFLRGDLRDVVELVPAVNPAGDAVFEVAVDVFDADAGEAELGFADVIGVFTDEDERRVEAEDARGPGGVLAGERDVDGAGDVGGGELHCGARVEDDGAFGLQAEDLGCEERYGRGEWSSEARPARLSSTSRPKYSGRGGRLSVRRWTNSSSLRA